MTRTAGIIGASRVWSMANISSDLSDRQRVEWIIRETLPEGSMGADGTVYQSPLPYLWTHLEPHYESMMLHLHYQHHLRGVKLLNGLMRKSREAERRSGRMAFRMLMDAASEHILHCLFWETLGLPSSSPGTELSTAIGRDFESQEKALSYFASLCSTATTRGWGVLGYNRVRDRLVIFVTGELVNLLSWPVRPLLVCDLWEHAYGWQYGSDRKRWVDNFLRMVNWPAVESRYLQARQARMEQL